MADPRIRQIIEVIGGERVQAVFNRLKTAGSRAFNSLQGSISRVNFSPIVTGAATATTRVNGLSASIKHLNTSLVAATNHIRAFGAAYVGFLSIRGIQQRVDVYSSLLSRIRLVTDSTEELAKVEKKLFDIADRTRGSFVGTVKLYAKLSTALSSQNIEQERVLRFTELINKAIKISGASAIEASAGLLQLGQAMASGRLQGDELRSILENISFLAKAIADGLGVEVGKLPELGKTGQLTSIAIFKAIEKSGKDIEEQFKNVETEIGKALGTLSDAFTRFIGKLDKAFDGSSVVVEFIGNITTKLGEMGDALKDDEIKAGIESIKEVFQGLGTVLGIVFSAMQGIYQFFRTGFTEIANTINQTFGTNIQPIEVFIATLAALLTVFGSLNIAITVVATFVGWLINQLSKIPQVQQLWAQFVASFGEGWKSIIASISATAFMQGLMSILNAFRSIFDQIWNYVSGVFDRIVSKAKSIGQGIVQSLGFAGDSEPQGFAEGGGVRGPGTSRSDSILARLSTGEFVVQARAVKRYGLRMMHAINNMRFPQFADGGLVSAPRYASGGEVAQTGDRRPLVLRIGDEVISGMTATEDTVDHLRRVAVRRKIQSAGRKPSWVS